MGLELSFALETPGSRGCPSLKDVSEAAVQCQGLAHDDASEPQSGIIELSSTGPIRVALVDSFAFTRECLIEVLAAAERELTVEGFDTLSGLTESAIIGFDVLLHYNHSQKSSGTFGITQEIGSQDGRTRIPTIILMDILPDLAPQAVKAALKCGVRAFVSAQTFDIKTVLAMIRLVRAGGIFVPVDLLIADDETNLVVSPDDVVPPAGPLTSREMAVVSLLQRGKANKIIAYELGISESTVKVHVRNFMRKMGAINRTQALYNLQQLGSRSGPSRLSYPLILTHQ